MDSLVLFGVGKLVPDLSQAIGLGHMYIVCGCVCFCVLIFILCFVPETKGLSLEDIEEYYREKFHGDENTIGKNEEKLEKISMYDRRFSMLGDEPTANDQSISSSAMRRSSVISFH